MITEPQVYEPDPSMDSADYPADDYGTEEPETPRDFVASYRDRIEVGPGRHIAGDRHHAGQRRRCSGSTGLDSSAASSPYLSQTGLQPGDVVLSVNGQPVETSNRTGIRLTTSWPKVQPG